MKICFITKEFKRGTGQGVYTYANNVINHVRKDHDITIVSDKLSSFIRNFISEQIILPLRTLFERCDIYHALSQEDGSVSCLIKRPSVVTFHDIIPITHGERHPIYRLYFRWCCFLAKRADAIIAVSGYTKNELSRVLGISPDRITVIHHGIDKKFKPLRKRDRGILTIGYLGGLGKRKNVETLIRSFALTENNGINARLIIGGTGPEYNNLVKLSKELNVKNIEFTGFVKDPVKFYNKLDIFVFPSLYEGFGFPVLEAMACGVPVITSNTSSMPEVCKDAALYLENPFDEKELAENIKTLINDKALRSNMTKIGLKRANIFTWEKSVKKLENVYKMILWKKENH